MGPSSTIPPCHQSQRLQGCPCVDCLHLSVVVMPQLLWVCWWAGLAPGLAGCKSWPKLLPECCGAGQIPSSSGFRVQLQLPVMWWCVVQVSDVGGCQVLGSKESLWSGFGVHWQDRHVGMSRFSGELQNGANSRLMKSIRTSAG